MPRYLDEDSSSSSDSHSSRRSGSRRSRTSHDDDDSPQYGGSSCGIKSVNEYQNKLVKGDPRIHRDSHTESQCGLAEAGASATNHGTGVVSAEAGFRLGLKEKKGRETHEGLRARGNADAEFGLGGAIAEAGADYTVYGISDDKARVDFAKGNIGGGVGIGAGGAKAKIDAGVDLVDAQLKLGKNQAMNYNVGLNANTGGEVGVDGVSAKVLGLGVSVGRNTGIHTPFGSLSFKLW